MHDLRMHRPLQRVRYWAGTLIGVRNATPSLSRNIAHGCTYSRGTRRHWRHLDYGTCRRPTGYSDRRHSAGGTTSGIPPLCALVRSGLSTGAAGMLTARRVTSPSESQRCLESLRWREEPTRCPPGGTIDSSNRADRCSYRDGHRECSPILHSQLPTRRSVT